MATGCKLCTSVEGFGQEVEMNVTYPYQAKDGENIVIRVTLTVGWLRDFAATLCIYESGTMKRSESIQFSSIYGQTITKDYTFPMNGRNLVFNISLMKPVLFGGYECDSFQTFTIFHQTPTYSCVSNVCTIDPSSSDTYEMCRAKGCGGGVPPSDKYTCPGVGKTCVKDSNSQYSYAECVAQGCTGAGGGGCGTGKIGLFGQCYKTSDVAIVGGAVVLLFVMMRQ